MLVGQLRQRLKLHSLKDSLSNELKPMPVVARFLDGKREYEIAGVDVRVDDRGFERLIVVLLR